MSARLTKKQEKLRGKKIINMTLEELHSWIKACDLMENSVKGNKARRSWTASRNDAENELQRRREDL